MIKVFDRAMFLVALLFIVALPGCFNDSSSPVQVAPLEKELRTNVTFVINGLGNPSSIRAAATPEVLFQLQLLDVSSSTNPVILLKKIGNVTAVAGGYQAVVEFTNVPVLPALAKMTITSGHIVDATDSVSYSTWVGLNDLVSGPINMITLHGEGGKTATDVAANLLGTLISTPTNVAILPTPIIDKINGIVAGLNLSSPTVYADALSAYNQLYPISPPADAEFTLPTGYTSIAYPKKDAATSLSISNFSATSQVYLVLMNRSSLSQTPFWSVSRAVANLRASRAAVNVPGMSQPNEEQKFHLWLRSQNKELPPPQAFSPGVRPSMRAVALNDQLPFTAYIDHDSNTSTAAVKGTVTAACSKIVDLTPTKKAYFFLDIADSNLPGVSSILDGMATAWSSIYAKNRDIFGAEPEGSYNGLAVNDFYILMSTKIYTAGYFYSGDLYPAATPGVDYSNEKKMFYLQYPSSIANLSYEIDSLASTMAHEFQHMIHFNINSNQTTWLDEAMSGYAEFINGYKIENGKNQSKALQVNYFFNTPSSVSLTNFTGGHENYGQVYLFGEWLAQNFGSNGSVQTLLPMTGTAAVAAFSGQTFDTIFARFMMSLMVNDTTGGVYGFSGLDLTGTYSYPGLSNVTLTGPKMATVDFSGATAGSPAISPYAAAYVKITNGIGTALNVNATLSSGISLFELKKN